MEEMTMGPFFLHGLGPAGGGVENREERSILGKGRERRKHKAGRKTQGCETLAR
jgi:hypothetical protein